jgi:hypothetical protein
MEQLISALARPEVVWSTKAEPPRVEQIEKAAGHFFRRRDAALRPPGEN